MKVLHLRHGRKYDIWAMCDDQGECQVTTMLMKVAREHPDLAIPMAVLLDEVVPHEGPPLHDEFRAKMVYRDIIFELKSDMSIGRKHLGFRVLFFCYSTNLIVCTNAFLKSSNTPPECLDFALSERARFHEDIDLLEFVT